MWYQNNLIFENFINQTVLVNQIGNVGLTQENWFEVIN